MYYYQLCFSQNESEIDKEILESHIYEYHVPPSVETECNVFVYYMRKKSFSTKRFHYLDMQKERFCLSMGPIPPKSILIQNVFLSQFRGDIFLDPNSGDIEIHIIESSAKLIHHVLLV
ncbi:MAG TPA: hypothetical protein VN704_06510 [Verrucomicrobiae bacterium]|nr:hypothetical protein [Verrucomicrobiae bacterium]